jgi:retinol dehydrogenase 12
MRILNQGTLAAEMQGQTIVITGATSGIGQVAAETLASMGARIVFTARSKGRGDATLARLREVAPDQNHTVHYGDLSRLTDLRRIGKAIAAAEQRIDVLINNAGAMFGHRQVTEDGLEKTLATNHLSYFVMTRLLSDRLIASAPSRIINTSSRAHFRGTLDFDNLQYEHDHYEGFPAYCRSKLCNILFTRILARRLTGTGAVANSLHPGFVKTRFADDSGGRVGRLFKFAKLFAISPQKGAETIIYLASAPEAAQANGLYFYKCKPIEPSKLAQDDAVAERLWKVTSEISGNPD